MAKAGLDQASKELAQAELGKERIRSNRGGGRGARTANATKQMPRWRRLAACARRSNDPGPTNGTVTTRMVDIGEVVATGAPLLEVVDLDRLYLQVYVPELQIGKVRLDLPARIHTDAFPDEPFEATVRYIASKAEFTPKEVQTPDERVKLIYAVRLYLTANPGIIGSHRGFRPTR